MAAEPDTLLLALDGRQFFLALLALEIGQPGLQHRHGLRAVLQLAAFDLTRHRDAGRLVDQAHRGAGLVDVLAARAGRAEDLHLDVGLVDVDVDVPVVEQRHDRQRRERRLALALRVERTHPHQSMHAPLGFQPAVRVATFDHELDRGQSRLAAGSRVLFLDVEAAPLRPAHVHAVEHLGPVLRVGTTLP